MEHVETRNTIRGARQGRRLNPDKNPVRVRGIRVVGDLRQVAPQVPGTNQFIVTEIARVEIVLAQHAHGASSPIGRRGRDASARRHAASWACSNGNRSKADCLNS